MLICLLQTLFNLINWRCLEMTYLCTIKALEDVAKNNRRWNKRHKKIMEWVQGVSWRSQSLETLYAVQGVTGLDDDDDERTSDSDLAKCQLMSFSRHKRNKAHRWTLLTACRLISRKQFSIRVICHAFP